MDLGTRWGVGGKRHAPAAEQDSIPIVQEAGWASQPVWIGVENLAPTGIRSSDLPVRSESLYRLLAGYLNYINVQSNSKTVQGQRHTISSHFMPHGQYYNYDTLQVQSTGNFTQISAYWPQSVENVLGAFDKKLRKVTIRFVTSVCPHRIIRPCLNGFSRNLIFEEV